MPSSNSDGSAARPPAWRVALASMPRPGKAVNEDLVGVAGPVAWLLDGATAPNSSPRCERDARWYVHQLAAALSAVLLGDDQIDLRSALAGGVATVAAEHRATCAGASQALGPSATVLVVRCRGRQLDYLVLGDSTLLVQTDRGVERHSDKRLGGVAGPLRRRIRGRLQQGQGYDNPTHRGLVGQLVTSERAVHNTEQGYWIAANDPAAATHSLTGSYRIGHGPGEVRRVALLSDGLERAVALLGIHPSHQALLRALVEHGPLGCIQAVRQAEAADPDGRRHPRTSASDDASAVVCEFMP